MAISVERLARSLTRARSCLRDTHLSGCFERQGSVGGPGALLVRWKNYSVVRRRFYDVLLGSTVPIDMHDTLWNWLTSGSPTFLVDDPAVGGCVRVPLKVSGSCSCCFSADQPGTRLHFRCSCMLWRRLRRFCTMTWARTVLP